MTPKEETQKIRAKRALVQKLVYRHEWDAFNMRTTGKWKGIPGEVIAALSEEEREIAKTLTADDFGFAQNRNAHWTGQVCHEWTQEQKRRKRGF